MTELDFYKRLKEMNIAEDEIFWVGDDLTINVPVYKLDDILDGLTSSEDYPLMIEYYQDNSVSIVINEILLNNEISPENILKVGEKFGASE